MSSSKDEPLNYRNPSSSSSPINDSDTNNYLIDHTVQIGSASGSFQSDSLLGGDGTGGGSGSNSDIEFGFMRPDFRQELLVGTVDYYERHVFLCYKNPRNWPPRIEAAEFDRLPRLLAAALSARKGDMKKETKLTICEGHDGSETSNGDVLIFPDMIRYRRLTHFDVDTFVEEVLVKDGEWLPGTPERLKGVYVFVCCHGSRDRRCGVCGPPLVSRFREEVDLLGLQGKVSISPCSHIGGHKYAGNVIIFGSKVGASVTGHWYGYVTPDDIPALLEQHIKRGKIVEGLWRGQMGLTEERQKKAQELRFQNYDGTSGERSLKQPSQLNEINGSTCSSQFFACCCQGDRNGACCQDTMSADKDDYGTTSTDADVAIEKKGKKQSFPKHGIKGGGSRKVCAVPTWLETWEREDTYAALAVIFAAVSVGVAYSYYKQLT